MIRRLAFALGLMLAAVAARAEVQIQTLTTPGGIPVWLVEDHALPFVAVDIGFDGGTSLDRPDKRGAVNLMTALLEEGSGDLDARGFARARDELAASIDFDVSDDSLTVSLRFLTETSDKVGVLVHDALTRPRFDADAVERVRAQVLSGLRSDAEDPGSIAARTMARALYGDHPYASDGSGTPASVAALDRDDLRAAFADAIARDRLHVSAVGDITPEALGAFLDAVLSGLPAAGAPEPGPATPAYSGKVMVVDYPTPQAVIRFAQPGLPMEDADFFPAYVLTQILGAGGFSSRLMTEIREKRGLTYGVGAYLVNRADADLIAGGMATANASVGESIALIRQEWAKLAAEGVSEDEVEKAKTFLTGAYPLRFDGNGRIAAILVGMQMDGMSADYIRTRNAKIEAVTRADVDRVAKSLLDPGKLSFVVVGKPEGIDASALVRLPEVPVPADHAATAPEPRPSASPVPVGKPVPVSPVPHPKPATGTAPAPRPAAP